MQGSPTKPDEAVSYRSTYKMNGGSIYATGASSMLPQNESTLNTVAVTFNWVQPVGQIYCIQSEAGTTIALLKSSEYSNFFMVSSPELQIGQTYHLYTGGLAVGEILVVIILQEFSTLMASKSKPLLFLKK